MKNSKWILMVLATALSFSVGCNKKKDSAAPVTQRTARGTGPVNYQPQNSQGMYYTASTGQITVSAQYGNEFTSVVKALVSATVPTNWVGRIDPTSGVTFRGYVEVNSAGQVIPGNSSISITIRDEFTGQMDGSQQIPPIYVNLPAVEGSAYNGQARIKFRDNYGEVTLVGQYVGNQFTGTVSYANSANADGGSPHSSDYMGNFRIETCGFFRCQ